MCLEVIEGFRDHSGEGMVNGIPAALVLVELEPREVEDPHELPSLGIGPIALGNELEPLGQSRSQSAEHFVHERGSSIGNDQDQITVLGPRSLDERYALVVAEELIQRRTQSLGRNGHPHKPSSTQRLRLVDY